MENKDLSRDFAIIFGIKPEEFPKQFSTFIDRVFNEYSKQNDKLSKAMVDVVEDGGFKNNAKENTTTEGIKMRKTDKQVLKEQIEELKKCSEMESSKTDEAPETWGAYQRSVVEDDQNKTEKQIVSDFLLNPCKRTSEKLDQTFKDLSELKKYSDNEESKIKESIDTLKGLARQSDPLPLESDKYKKAPNMESGSLVGEPNIHYHAFPKTAKYQNDDEVKTQDKYIVSFKDGKPPITITKSMFNSLSSVYLESSNLNGYNIFPGLLFALDEYTGEMICLDSSSILSIVKYK